MADGMIVDVLGNPVALTNPDAVAAPTAVYQPVDIPMTALLEDAAFDAHQDYLALSRSINQKDFDVNSKPPAWKCILDELVYTVAQDPAFIDGHWPVRDVLMRLVKLGLVAADRELKAQEAADNMPIQTI